MSPKGVALVTGAGQGIGRAIALRLADDGFDIAVNGTSATKLELVVREIQSKQRRASLHVADVSVEEQVRNMIKRVVEEHGSLDVIVANAATVKYQSILETSEEDWDRQFAVNTKGVFFCYKYAAAQMIAQGRKGRIIAATSAAGKQGVAKVAAYSSSKFAVSGLTQAAALEFGPHGITVNAYAPGAVKTAMLDYTHNAAGAEVPGGFKAQWESNSAVKRLGEPEDMANLVSFLASEESSFITGQTICSNGGVFFD